MTPQSPCPDPELLRKLLTGPIAESQVEILERHLDQCSSCVRKSAAQAQSDELLAAIHSLGAPGGGPSLEDLENVKPLIARLKGLASAVGRAAAASQEDAQQTSRPEYSAGDVPPLAASELPTPAPVFIGRYRILGHLGSGGMGVVSLAHDPQLNRMVAVKVPRFEGTPEEQAAARERFAREPLAAAALGHPNICTVYDVGEHQGAPYVVMEYVEGPSLAERLGTHGRYENCREAARLVGQIAKALQAVHDAGLIHRDVKPGNILLDPSGEAKLTDFGTALQVRAAERLTKEGAAVGTPAYMAPEQIQGPSAVVDPRCDVYSLGVVLYEMLTGRLPHAGSESRIIVQRLDGEKVPRPSQVRKGLDLALDAIVCRAMAHRVGDRYDDARTFSEALTVWLTRRKMTGVWALLAAGAAGLALIVLLCFRVPSGSRSASDASISPWHGSIDVLVYDPDNVRRQNRHLNDPDVLPLKPGDGVAIEVEMSPPAYLYVLWVGADGTVDPVYPWEPGDWSARPADEQPVRRLRRPADSFYPLKPSAQGMETLVLLTRETPLPQGVDLKAELGNVEPQTLQKLESTVWFENGTVVTNEQGAVRSVGTNERSATRCRRRRG